MSIKLPPININRILYATDLSETALHALAYAVDMADRHQARLVILHVLDEIPRNVDSWVVGYLDADKWEKIKTDYVDEVEDMLQRRKRGNVVMEKVLEQCSRDLRAKGADFEDEIVVRRGNAVARILETAENQNCDMIVVGSHGQGDFLDAMLGTTAQRVVRRSKVPVMVVRLPEED